MKQQMRNHTVQYSFCLRIMTHKKQTNMEIVSIHSATQILWQYYGSSYHLTLLFLMSKENVVSSFLSTIDLILGVGQGAASYQSAALGRGNRSIKCLPLALFLSRFLLQPTWARKARHFVSFLSYPDLCLLTMLPCALCLLTMSKFQFWIFNLQCGGIWGAFGNWEGLDMVRWDSFLVQRWRDQSSLFPHCVRTQQEGNHLWTRGKALTKNPALLASSCQLPSLQNRNKCLLPKPPSLWYSNSRNWLIHSISIIMSQEIRPWLFFLGRICRVFPWNNKPRHGGGSDKIAWFREEIKLCWFTMSNIWSIAVLIHLTNTSSHSSFLSLLPFLVVVEWLPYTPVLLF